MGSGLAHQEHDVALCRWSWLADQRRDWPEHIQHLAKGSGRGACHRGAYVYLHNVQPIRWLCAVTSWGGASHCAEPCRLRAAMLASGFAGGGTRWDSEGSDSTLHVDMMLLIVAHVCCTASSTSHHSLPPSSTHPAFYVFICSCLLLAPFSATMVPSHQLFFFSPHTCCWQSSSIA